MSCPSAHLNFTIRMKTNLQQVSVFTEKFRELCTTFEIGENTCKQFQNLIGCVVKKIHWKEWMKHDNMSECPFNLTIWEHFIEIVHKDFIFLCFLHKSRCGHPLLSWWKLTSFNQLFCCVVTSYHMKSVWRAIIIIIIIVVVVVTRSSASSPGEDGERRGGVFRVWNDLKLDYLLSYLSSL